MSKWNKEKIQSSESSVDWDTSKGWRAKDYISWGQKEESRQREVEKGKCGIA